MSTVSAFRDDATRDTTVRRILVWDAPVRLCHWLMVLCFTGAWLTAESEYWRLIHVTLGYTMAGLVAFRILWGIIGTRYARFASFVRGPRAVVRYVGSCLKGRPDHHTGHNPAGALAIVALLVLELVVVASGWAAYSYIDDAANLHEGAASLMLALVGVHIAAVLASSGLHGENLVRAMITGRKLGRPDEGISRARSSTALMILVVVLGFWWFEWQTAPSGLELTTFASTAKSPSAEATIPTMIEDREAR